MFCHCTVTQLQLCFFHIRAPQTLVAAPSSLLTVQHITLPFSSLSWKPKKACQLRTLSRHSSRVRSCNKFQASKHCQAAVRNYSDALSDSKQTVWCWIYLCESNNITRTLWYILHPKKMPDLQLGSMLHPALSPSFLEKAISKGNARGRSGLGSYRLQETSCSSTVLVACSSRMYMS